MPVPHSPDFPMGSGARRYSDEEVVGVVVFARLFFWFLAREVRQETQTISAFLPKARCETRRS